LADESIQKVMDYKSVFGSEQGQRVLADLDKRFLYRQDMFDADSERVTCFNLGKNTAIRYIHSQIDKKMDEPEQGKVKNEGVKL
jgi:uncharacterized protein YfeS